MGIFSSIFQKCSSIFTNVRWFQRFLSSSSCSGTTTTSFPLETSPVTILIKLTTYIRRAFGFSVSSVRVSDADSRATYIRRWASESHPAGDQQRRYRRYPLCILLPTKKRKKKKNGNNHCNGIFGWVVMWYSTAGVRGSDPIHRRGPTSTFPFVSFLYIYI